MNLAAVRHSATGRDCYALMPGRFVFRLCAARGDLARAVLHHQDKYMPLRFADTRAETPMALVARDACHDYWEAEVCFDVVCLRYWFELTDTAGRTAFYSNYEWFDAPPADIDRMFDCPQTLREEALFAPPAWAAGKVVYQVFPNRFASSRDVPEKLWYKAPIGAREDLRGDLAGIRARLPHLKNLGADVLYMTPIFRGNTTHKYDTVDYYQIDPAFGTAEDLTALVADAHALGLRVILDGVFNHTSPDFFAFADVAANGPKSRYWDWYYIKGYPLRHPWPGKPNYKCFSYFGGMPKLNLHNPETAAYVTDVALYWLRTAGIDGWRLDVGDEIGHAFWRQFRARIKAEFPEALLIGEVWHQAEDFLQGDEWDTVMNYVFCFAVRDVLTGQAPVSRLLGQLSMLRGTLHRAVWPLLWNLVDSHDAPRLLRVCGGEKARMRLAAALQMLLPGMPMLYYGDEYAMDGGQDPDCRRGMLWDPARQDGEMFRWYQKLLALRHAHPCLAVGALEEPLADDGAAVLVLPLRQEADRLTLVFHAGEGEAALPALAGRQDLLTGAPFPGRLGRWSAAVLADETQRM